MLKLAAYSSADLQKFTNLLHQMERAGVSIAVAKKEVLVAIAGEEKAMLIDPQKTKQKQLCPACGSPLLPAAPIEGLVRMGCPKCRYSKIISEAQ